MQTLNYAVAGLWILLAVGNLIAGVICIFFPKWASTHIIIPSFGSFYRIVYQKKPLKREPFEFTKRDHLLLSGLGVVFLALAIRSIFAVMNILLIK